MTPQQIESFQRTHRNHLGVPLKVDGDQGPETEWALDFETLSVHRQAIILCAQVYLGLEESPPGSNDDPHGMIRSWLEHCGARPGDRWCASFVSHCLSASSPAPARVQTRIASAQKLGKSLRATSQPWVGDVMWYPTDETHGHCGLVLGVSADEVMTIEGNQANAVRCVRRPRQGLRFASTLDDETGTCPGVVPRVPAPHGGAGATR